MMRLTKDCFTVLLPSYRRGYFEVVSFYVVLNIVCPSLMLSLFTTDAFHMAVHGAWW